MAQYDVHRLRDGDLVLDCQSNFVDFVETRLVVPLVEPEFVLAPLPRLHPAFLIQGERFLMATHLAASISAQQLDRPIASLADESFTIVNAFDMLLTGF